jgi:hypothetical protein
MMLFNSLDHLRDPAELTDLPCLSVLPFAMRPVVKFT